MKIALKGATHRRNTSRMTKGVIKIMKTIKNLYPKIYDFENLYKAWESARKGKRFRDEVLAFSNNLEENLIDIQNHLIYGTYRVGKYRPFYVYEPKKRLVMALPFRDRVVQWAVYRQLFPILNKHFIFDSYARALMPPQIGCNTG